MGKFGKITLSLSFISSSILLLSFSFLFFFRWFFESLKKLYTIWILKTFPRTLYVLLLSHFAVIQNKNKTNKQTNTHVMIWWERRTLLWFSTVFLFLNRNPVPGCMRMGSKAGTSGLIVCWAQWGWSSENQYQVQHAWFILIHINKPVGGSGQKKLI